MPGWGAQGFLPGLLEEGGVPRGGRCLWGQEWWFTRGGCQQCPSVPDAAHNSLRWRVRRRLQTSAQNGSKGSVLPSPRQPEPKVSAAALQPLRPAPLFVTPWTAARQASVPLTSSQSLPKLMHVHRVGDAIQPSHRLLPSSPFAFNLSQPRALAAVL